MTATQTPSSGSPLARVGRIYGAHPVHLAVLLAGFVVAALALGQLLDERPVAVGTWLVGAAVLHDGVFVLGYIAADALLVALWRRRPGRVAWLNFVRVPAAVSGILLLAFYPVIARQATSFEGKTGREMDAYLGRWLLVTAVLAGLSAACYLARLVAVRRGRPAGGAAE